MVTSPRDDLLVTGDTKGYVAVWNIKDYLITHQDKVRVGPAIRFVKRVVFMIGSCVFLLQVPSHKACTFPGPQLM